METEAWPYVVALGLAVVVGTGTVAVLRRLNHRRHKVYIDEQVADAPLAGAPTLSSKQLRSWMTSARAKPSTAWTADLEKIVEEYAQLEGRCEEFTKENETLKREVDSLSLLVRKGGCQTPMSSITLSTTLNSLDATPSTSQSLTPKSDLVDDAPATRPPSSERAASSLSSSEQPDAREPLPAAPLALPRSGLLEPLPPTDEPLSPSSSCSSEAVEPAVLRPTPQQSVNEAKQTFTPLFDERVLSTPRSLEEIVQGHRVTKKSLGQRIKRRQQQTVMHAGMVEQQQEELPRAAAAAGDRASLNALVEEHAARVAGLEQVVGGRRDDRDQWLSCALKLQARLDTILGVRRMDQMASPAGILMSARCPKQPVALGHFALPAARDLSNLGVNPYRVDSWPIEPNSRYTRPSQGETALPPMSEGEEPSEEEPEEPEETEEPEEPEEPEESSEAGVVSPGAPAAPAQLPAALALPDDLLAAAELLTPDDLAESGDAEPELVSKPVPKRLPPLALNK